MKDFFKEIFEYTYIFNNKVVDSLLLNSNGLDKSVQLINHTISAQQIWIARIENTSASIGVWDIRPIEDLKAINESNYVKSLEILENYDLNKIIRYTNTKGETYDSSIKDILFHAINHSTYHRGQIATDFKQNGVAPLVSDYIFFKRQSI